MSLPAFSASITARVPNIRFSSSIANKVHQILSTYQIKDNAAQQPGRFCEVFVKQYLYKNLKMEALYRKVEDALDTIRPYLEADGGNVEVIEITTDQTLKI